MNTSLFTIVKHKHTRARTHTHMVLAEQPDLDNQVTHTVPI